MTRRLVVTPRARSDLVEIGSYVAQDNPAAADRLLDRLAEASRLVAEQPGIGRPDDARPGRRIFIVGNYLLIYKEAADGVSVLRYVHGRRDRPTL